MTATKEQEYEEFKTLLNEAIDQFKSQGTEIETLKGTVETLTKAVTLMKAQTPQSPKTPSVRLQDRYGFQDEDEAKRFCQFANACFLENRETLKELSTDSDPDGGFTIPEEFRPTLIRLIEVFGLARRLATVIPMSRDELVMPKLTEHVVVYWIGEGKTIPSTSAQFGEMRMVAKKLAALLPITSELLEDSSLAIANLVATLFAEKIAEEEDRVVFTGDRVNAGDPFEGVLHDANVVSIVLPSGSTNFADLTGDDMADATAALTSAASNGARWYMHRTIFNVVRKLKSSSGSEEYIFQQPAGTQPGSIWTYPYDLTDVMPSISQSAVDTPFVILGNLRHYYIGDRKAMTMARSEHVGFAQDKIFLRVLQRIAMAMAIPGAFSVIRTAAS